MTSSLKTVAAAAAGLALLTACHEQPAETPAEPIPLEEVRPRHSEDMQSALNGYMATHGLTKEDLRAGLVIPWVAAGSSAYSGYLTATGEMSPGGCPVFNASTFDNISKYTWRRDNLLAMCPD